MQLAKSSLIGRTKRTGVPGNEVNGWPNCWLEVLSQMEGVAPVMSGGSVLKDAETNQADHLVFAAHFRRGGRLRVVEEQTRHAATKRAGAENRHR